MDHEQTKDRGPYMHSASGFKLYPFDPRPEEIHIDTIAHHLACNNRWNGATRHPTDPTRISFSVAEHSILVARYVVEILDRPDLELEALLHDASEHIFQDMIKPIKYHPMILPIYKPLENRVEQVIAQKFKLQFPYPPEIKIADNAVCSAEAIQIVPRHPQEDYSVSMHDDSRVAPYEIEMLSAYEAKQAFLNAYTSAVMRREGSQRAYKRAS